VACPCQLPHFQIFFQHGHRRCPEIVGLRIKKTELYSTFVANYTILVSTNVVFTCLIKIASLTSAKILNAKKTHIKKGRLFQFNFFHVFE
jgi:hypothetical protein